MINDLVIQALLENTDHMKGIPIPKSVVSHTHSIMDTNHGTRMNFFGRPHLRRHIGRKKRIMGHLDNNNFKKAIINFNKMHGEKIL